MAISDLFEEFSKNRLREVANQFPWLARGCTAGALFLVAAASVHTVLGPHLDDTRVQMAYAFLQTFLFVVTAILVYWRLPQKLPRTETFPNLISADAPEPMPRDKELGALIDLLKDPSMPVFVAGPSGSGKTYLMRSILGRHTEGGDWDFLHVDESSMPELQESVRAALRSHNRDFVTADYGDVDGGKWFEGLRGKRTVLVVDQVERLLRRSDSEKSRDALYLKRLIQECAGAEVRVCLVIRDDCYCELKVFADSADIFGRTIFLEGFRLHESSPDGFVAMKLLRQVCDDQSLFQAILDDLGNRRVLPVEVRVLGFVVEALRSDEFAGVSPLTKDTFREIYGGYRGFIEKYFALHIDATPDRQTARALLYALSSSGVVRREYDTEELQFTTHRNVAVIRSVRDSLIDGGLIRPGGKVALMHDYLAASYREASARFLTPIDRDNINHFNSVLETQGVGDRSPSVAPDLRPNGYFNLGFGSLLCVVCGRLVYPAIGGVPGSAESGTISPPGLMLDLEYLPAFIGSIACGAYVWRVFANVLLGIKEKRWLTRFAMIASIAMILFGTVVPRAWPIFASVAGTTIGLRMMVAGKGRASMWLRDGFSFLTRLGSVTIFAMFVVGLLGVLEFVLVPIVLADDPALIYSFDLMLAMCVAFFMLVVIRDHADRSSGPGLLGLIDRVRM